MRTRFVPRPFIRTRERWIKPARPIPQVLSLLYQGQPMPVMSIGPSWEAGCLVSERYKTIINEALDTSEDRERTYPRCQYDIEYQPLTLEAQESAYIRTVFELALALPVICPLWPDGTKLTSDAAAQSTSLVVEDMRNYRFTGLRYALVIDRFDNWEVVEIADYSDDGLTLTLVGSTSKAWTHSPNFGEGAMVYPVCIGWLKRPEAKHETDEASQFSVQFEERTFDGNGEAPSAPDLELAMSNCKEAITFSWNAIDGADGYKMEYSDSSTGPWTTYLANIAVDVTSIEVNNSYSLGKYWRLRTKSGTSISKPSNVLQSVGPNIEPCAITVSNTTALPNMALPPVDTLWGGRKINTNPVSKVENAYIEPLNRYTAISERRDYFYDPDSITTSAINVTCPTVGATIEWCTDGTDPVLGGPNDQTLPHQNGFGCIVKARAFKDGCAGPVTIVLVDKRVQALGWLTVPCDAASVSSSGSRPTYAFVPIYDSHGNQVGCQGNYNYAGDDFRNILNPPGLSFDVFSRPAILNQILVNTCASATDAFNPQRYLNYVDLTEGAAGGSYPISFSDVPPCLLVTGGGTYTFNVAVKTAKGATFARDATFWNAASVSTHANMIALQCVTGQPGDMYKGADDLLGPGGTDYTVSYNCNSTVLNCRSICWTMINTFAPAPQTVFTQFDKLQIILTRELDNPIFNPQ